MLTRWMLERESVLLIAYWPMTSVEGYKVFAPCKLLLVFKRVFSKVLFLLNALVLICYTLSHPTSLRNSRAGLFWSRHVKLEPPPRKYCRFWKCPPNVCTSPSLPQKAFTLHWERDTGLVTVTFAESQDLKEKTYFSTYPMLLYRWLGSKQI